LVGRSVPYDVHKPAEPSVTPVSRAIHGKIPRSERAIIAKGALEALRRPLPLFASGLRN
jgi:hypothetical protein